MDRDLTWYVDAVTGGERYGLSKAITLVESTRPDHRELAGELIAALPPPPDTSIRLGLSGVPGVGKSTFIERFGLMLIDKGHRVAVLTIDPTSPLSGGSILGDKTRMPELSAHERAFIRPSPAGDALGGVAWRTRETMLLLEAAGYDYLIVETVGVGQSETDVADMVDFFLVLMLAGAGDELQGIKRGILEMVDALVINKVDEVGQQRAMRARSEYQSALGLFSAGSMHEENWDWQPPVLLASGLTGEGLEDILATITDHQTKAAEGGVKGAHRRHQNLQWFRRLLREELMHRFRAHPGVTAQLKTIEDQVKDGHQSAWQAAQQMLALVFGG